MWSVLSIRIDSKMKKALVELAEEEFSPVSTIVKKAVDKYLQDHGKNWRVKKNPTVKD